MGDGEEEALSSVGGDSLYVRGFCPLDNLYRLRCKTEERVWFGVWVLKVIIRGVTLTWKNSLVLYYCEKC